MALSLFSLHTVDKLTKDPCLSAKRKYSRNHGDRVETGKQMFRTSLYAHAIAVLADATVQEAILLFGYGVYYYRHILKVRAKRRSVVNGDQAENSIEICSASEDLGGGVLLSFFFKSSSLFVSRTTAWVASSAGACIGTMILPGWGTLVGTQLGDGLAGSLFEST